VPAHAVADAVAQPPPAALGFVLDPLPEQSQPLFDQPDGFPVQAIRADVGLAVLDRALGGAPEAPIAGADLGDEVSLDPRAVAVRDGVVIDEVVDVALVALGELHDLEL